MKKLKVILPAILTLAVSTSAAVTGTVAWFTANRLQVVKTTGVTVVNPEAGLLLNDVTNLANTRVQFDAEGSPNKYTVTHGKVLKNGGNPETDNDWDSVYLRDASVNMASTPDVYRAVLNETGGWDRYEIVDSTYPEKDGKTYGGTPVVYATAYKLNFSPSSTNDSFNYSLFLDIKNSTVTATDVSNSETAAHNTDLNKALRLGFKQGNDWFVWAPFADKAVTTTPAEGEYRATYINGTDKKDGIANYNAADFLIGNAASATGPEVPSESKATGVVAKENNETKAGDSYFGYLGVLDSLYNKQSKTGGTEVTVFTWFEGTDLNCQNDNFTGSLDNISSTLNFVMRRTAKA